MNQILHIFRKDARRHWPEILVSIALLTAFVVEQPYKWTGLKFHTRVLEGLVSMLPAAMVLAWAFLIIRLVQSEALAGNRQFWITRPYEWHKLLAAKLLSIVVFVHLPFFLSQVVLLGIGRFPFLPSVTGLLFVHVLFFMAIVVPSLTVGSITTGIGQAALAILAAFLVIAGFATIMFVKLDMDVAADSTDWLVGPIYMSACVCIIVLQYLYRSTFLTRLIALGAATVIALVMLLAPYEKIISGWFPLPWNSRPIPARLKFDRTLTFAHREGWSPASYENEVDLEIPFEVSELDDKSLIDIRAIKLDLDLPDGRHWTSQWHSVYHHSISFGRSHVWPDFNIKKEMLDRVKNGPVRAHVTLGMDVFRLGVSNQTLMSGNRISIPGGARCLNDMSQSSLDCFAALMEPNPMFVVAELPNPACPVAKDETGRQWASSPAVFADLTVSSTPDLAFTPIQQFSIELSRYYSFEDLPVRLPICSGTHLVINKPLFQYSVRDEIDLGEIRLTDYHPTYPRKINPPAKQPASDAPSNTRSWNRGPELLFPQTK